MAFSPTTVTGTAVLEYGPAETLPPVGAISKHRARLCRPSRQASRAHPRGKPGFWAFESGCGRETDSLLEGAGFEPSVPRECARWHHRDTSVTAKDLHDEVKKLIDPEGGGVLQRIRPWFGHQDGVRLAGFELRVEKDPKRRRDPATYTLINLDPERR
jgi:hypothetical protein